MADSLSRHFKWPELGSPEDANATHRWARECLEMWEAERATLLARLAEAEQVVYELCDAWDGNMPPDHIPDPGSVLFAVWTGAAGYHAKYRMASPDEF